jgi:hypothetical protein
MIMSWGMMLMVLGNNGSTDLVSALDAPGYFQSRNIEVKADKMLELAGKAPTGGKEAVAQLLAIRWLGEHPNAVKASKNAREVLRQIAAGKKGKDAQGFAGDYARLALARLDGKTLPPAHLPADGVRGEGLQWFPKQSTIFGCFDFRPPKGVVPGPDDLIRRLLAKEMPKRAKEEMYHFVDKVGNVRIDRVSFAVVADPNQDSQTRLFIRLTGKGDRKRLATVIQQGMRPKGGQGPDVKEKKAPNGEPMTILDAKSEEPVYAFVGDTDMLICGFPDGREQGKQGLVLEQALQVMAGKEGSIAKGPYANTLKTTPKRTNGLLIGALPDRWHKGITETRGSPFRGFPQHFNVTLRRNAKGVRIDFTGSASNAKEAKAFVDSAQQLKQQGLEGLKKVNEFVKVDAKIIASLQTALKSIKMENRDALLTGGAAISNDAVKATMEMMRYVLVEGGPRPRPDEGPKRR